MISKLISKLLARRSAILPLGSVLAIASIPIITVITSGNLVSADTNTDYIFLLERDRNCQQIESAFQEVKAFETANFYVNICQKDRNYYYLGEAKTGNLNTIFIPANSLASGEMYRANNGNVTYIVNILPNGATLTIERNGTQIAIESSLKEQCIAPQTWQMNIASQMYYPLSNNLDGDLNHLKLEPVEIDFYNFYEFNSGKYNPEAILNVSTCD